MSSTPLAFNVVFPLNFTSNILHVLCDGCVADGVGCSRDGGLATIAATTAVQARHVNPVQIIMVLPPSMAQRLVLTVLLAPAKHHTTI